MSSYVPINIRILLSVGLQRSGVRRQYKSETPTAKIDVVPEIEMRTETIYIIKMGFGTEMIETDGMIEI